MGDSLWLEEHSSLLGYKNKCFYSLMPTQLCVSLTGGLAEHSKPPKLGVLLSSRLGKQASVSSADTQAAAINTAKLLSTDKVRYIPWHWKKLQYASNRSRTKTNNDLADSSGLTIPKGIKAKLFEDPAMQDAQHLWSIKSVSLKIRSYATQRKDNCKLTEML